MSVTYGGLKRSALPVGQWLVCFFNEIPLALNRTLFNEDMKTVLKGLNSAFKQQTPLKPRAINISLSAPPLPWFFQHQWERFTALKAFFFPFYNYSFTPQMDLNGFSWHSIDPSGVNWSLLCAACHQSTQSRRGVVYGDILAIAGSKACSIVHPPKSQQ